MSIIVVNGPQANEYYAKAQVPEFKVKCSRHLDVAVRLPSGAVLFNASYAPGFSDYVYFDIKDILDASLFSTLENSINFKQSNFLLPIIVSLSDEDQDVNIPFKVMNIKAKIKGLSSLSRNFLTFQPSVKKINSQTPEHLTYLFTEQGQKLVVNFYLISGSQEKVTLYVNDSDSPECRTLDVSLKTVMQLSNTSSSQKKTYYDVYVVNSSGVRISNRQRYIYGDFSSREKYYLFANSLGGIDTLTCVGQRSIAPDVTYNIGDLTDVLVQLDDTDDIVKYKQNSGYFSRNDFKWAIDFVMSKGKKYVYDADDDIYTPIVIVDSNLGINDHDGFTTFDFSYRCVEGDEQIFEPAPASAQQIVVTSTMSKDISYEVNSRNIDVSYDSSKNAYDTDIMECTTSGGMMIQVASKDAQVSIYSSSNKSTWTLVETVYVEESTIRQFDNAPEGSYWRVESNKEITMIKMFI